MITFLRRWFEQPQPEPTTQNNLPHCVFIHGANQSKVCWNFIIKELELSQEQYTAIEYNTLNSFYDNLQELVGIIENTPNNSVLISHSLGGIYALHLHKHFPNKFSKSISISTPFRGSTAAEYLRYLSPQTKLFRDIGKRSKPIVEANEVEITIPWTQIVSIRGNSPWLREGNDGIVTIESQRHRDDIDYIEIDANHYEILVAYRTVKAIKDNICLTTVT